MKNLLIIILLLSGNILAQQSAIITYGSSAKSATSKTKMTTIIGQSLVGDGADPVNFSSSMSLGFWSILKLPPLTPYVYASDGDYSNRVEITWSLDPLSPPAKYGYKLFRDNSLISEISTTSDAYQDYNIISGNFYEYELLGVNDYGEGAEGYDVGFMNPNGVITGSVSTSQGAASVDTEVYLDPMLGKSLFFSGADNVSVSLYELYKTQVDSVLESYGLTDELTLELWIKPVSEGSIFFSGDIDSLNTNMTLEADNSIAVNFPTGNDPISSEPLATDVWSHIALNINSAEIKLFVNGELDSTIANSDASLASEILAGSISFGAETRRGEDIGQNYFEGYLDDMRIWTNSRSADNITKHMNRTIDIDEEGLMAYWKFDEGSGSLLFDQTEHSWDGTIFGGTFTDDIAEIRTSAFSDENGNFYIGGVYYGSGQTFSVIPQKETPLGTSIIFDGTNEIELEADTSLFSKDAFTISFWYYMSEGGSGENLFIQKTLGDIDTDYFKIFKHSTNQITARGQFGSNWVATERTETEVLENSKWYYVSAVFDKVNLTLYVFEQDGNLLDEVSVAVTDSRVVPDTTYSFLGQGIKGSIDEFMYWQSARTSDQIKLDMTGDNITFDDDGNYEDVENESLVTYLKFNEGFGTFAADNSLSGVNAVLSDSLAWNNEDIPLDEVFDHEYSPGARYVTLNESNTSKDDVVFTDVSLLEVTGYVRFENTSCYANIIEILVDGASASPEVYTDENGKFVLELEPGSSVWLSPSYGDFSFSPVFFQIENLSNPIAGIVFDITTTRTFDGYIAGGNCMLSIAEDGEVVSLRMESENGCFEESTTVNSSGYFSFGELPPLDYFAFVEHDNPTVQDYFDLVGGESISLRDTSATFNFIYYTDLITEITFPNESLTCDTYVFQQGDSVLVRAKIYEQYPGGECDTDLGSLIIKNKIGDEADREVEFVEGEVDLYIYVGQPNTLDGGDYPYQKLLQISATDSIGRITTDEIWAYVEGLKQGENTFTTVTPEFPTIILRDSPGDQSYAYLEKGYSTTSGVKIIAGTGLGTKDKLYAGFGDQSSFGLGVSKTFEWNVLGGPSVSFEENDTKETLEIRTTVTSDAFRTNNLDGLVGNEGDIFVGAAFVLQFGTGLNLTINDTSGTCVVNLDTVTTVIPDTIATTFIYSESHLKSSIVPNLEFLLAQTSADSIVKLAYYENQIGLWNDILDRNDSLKSEANLEKNISFDAGTVYDYSYTTGADTADNDGKNYSTEDGVVFKVAWQYGSTGFIEGYGYGSYSYEKVNIDKSSGSNTIAYHLEDDDAGDFYSVNILTDETYGTPVFEVVSGQSSCPWEPGTRPRNGVSLLMDSYEATDVAPSEPAVFSIYLGNTSQSDETRTYNLLVNQESNKNGATVKVNGILIEDHLSYTIPSGQQLEGILTVEKGPGSYVADTLQITFQSECDAGTSIPDDSDLSVVFTETAEFVVNWVEPCSEVEIDSPSDGWLLTSDDNNILPITLSGYEKDNEDFSEIKIQFKKKIIIPGSNSAKTNLASSEIMKTGSSDLAPKQKIIKNISINKQISKPNSIAISKNISKITNSEILNKGGGKGKIQADDWVTIVTIPRDSLDADYYIYNWDISELIDTSQDGSYEIRAVTFCTDPAGNSGISSVMGGLIDRTAPSLVGEPRPVDKVLGLDDEVAFYFDENIDCSKIDPNQDISLINNSTGELLNYDFTCTENKIIFTPTDNNIYLEHEYLKVSINNIYDIYGNGDTSKVYEWEFFVDRNPMRWDGHPIDEYKLDDEEITITRKLVNEGGEDFSYKIIEVPDWLTVSPMEGVVTAKHIETISFTISDEISHGNYIDTVYAETSDGDEPMVINLNNLCHPPDWSVNPNDYKYTMTITGNIENNDVLSEDLCDVVYAYVGQEVRGVAELQYIQEIDGVIDGVNPYQFYMTVYSNSTVLNSELLVLRVWDASEREVVTQSNNYYYFDPNLSIGTPTEPDLITTSSLALQEKSMNKGWNWMSLNLQNEDMTPDYILSFINSEEGDDNIIGHDYYADNSAGVWIGDGSELSNNQMYKIFLSEENTLEYFGEPIDLDSSYIALDSNWNWIGYHPNISTSLNDALSSLTPKGGDIIKNQKYFSTYIDSVGWVGSLSYMEPGDGYQLKISSKDTLRFSSASTGRVLAKSNKSIVQNIQVDSSSFANSGWEVNPHDFEFTMSIVGELNPTQFANINDNDIIGAFVNGECRGIASPLYIDALEEHRIFLTVYSNVAVNDTVEFKLFDSVTREEIEVDNSELFASNKIIGSVIEPLVFTIVFTGIWNSGLVPVVYSLSQNYPNPFNPETTIQFGLPLESEVNITIYNILGQRVSTLINKEMKAGYYFTKWHGDDDSGRKVASGVYIYRMNANGIKKDFTETKKLMILK